MFGWFCDAKDEFLFFDGVFSRVAGYDTVTSHVNCFLGMDILPLVE